MTNAWAPWYAEVTEAQPYLIDDDDATYRLGAEWLAGLDIADWGCGLGWMRRYVPPDRYLGIDGTDTPFADVVVDLETYREPSESVFMRHVLEHNLNWPQILDNALHSFRRRLFIALYTPLVDMTHVHLVEPTLGVPEIRFRLEDITQTLQGFWYRVNIVGSETVLKVER